MKLFNRSVQVYASRVAYLHWFTFAVFTMASDVQEKDFNALGDSFKQFIGHMKVRESKSGRWEGSPCVP